jgi:UDP-N-acetylglucosamine--N-acetylmuramyl-(pentapeptide) pyrophosphoryl-undecaprenol N-acetylglucosamine transferase
MKNIVFVGGGTAGHVYPNLAIIENMNKNKYHFFYIGGKGMEKDILAKEKNIKYFEIEPVKFQRILTLQNLLIPTKLFKAIRDSKKILKEIKADIIFSKGGFVSVPVVIAGAKLGIPVISHESDLSMGLANKIILHYCDKMCTSFKDTCPKHKKVVFTGQPIRQKVLSGNKRNLPFFKNLDKYCPVILVVGGSSGAKFLNDKIIKNIDKLCKDFNVIHITGKQEHKKINHKNYFQVDYAENIGDFLDAANIVVSRAGSGAINEFLALQKPMLLIPLSKRCSRGDQIENAKLFKKQGFCDMLEEEDCEDVILIEKIKKIIKNDKKYTSNMKKYSSFNATDKIIDIIEETLKL